MTILLPTNESLLLVTKGPQEQMKPNPRNLITRVDTLGWQSFWEKFLFLCMCAFMRFVIYSYYESLKIEQLNVFFLKNKKAASDIISPHCGWAWLNVTRSGWYGPDELCLHYLNLRRRCFKSFYPGRSRLMKTFDEVKVLANINRCGRKTTISKLNYFS